MKEKDITGGWAFLQAGHPEQRGGSKLKRIGRSGQPVSFGPGMIFFSMFGFPCFEPLLCFQPSEVSFDI